MNEKHNFFSSYVLTLFSWYHILQHKLYSNHVFDSQTSAKCYSRKTFPFSWIRMAARGLRRVQEVFDSFCHILGCMQLVSNVGEHHLLLYRYSYYDGTLSTIHYYSGSSMRNSASAFEFRFSGIQQYIWGLKKCNIKSKWKTLIAFLLIHGFSSVWLLNWFELRPIRPLVGAYSQQHRPRWKVHICLKVSLKCMNEWKYLFFIHSKLYSNL